MSDKEVEKRLIADCERCLAALRAARASTQCDLFGRCVADAEADARTAIDKLKRHLAK